MNLPSLASATLDQIAQRVIPPVEYLVRPIISNDNDVNNIYWRDQCE